MTINTLHSTKWQCTVGQQLVKSNLVHSSATTTLALKFNIDKAEKENIGIETFILEKGVLAMKVPKKYKTKILKKNFISFWYFFLIYNLYFPVRMFQCSMFSVPNFNVCSSLIYSSYFPWLLCVLRKKCDISGTPRHAVVLAGSSANAQSHRVVWLRLPPQFKTDALHQHWQLRGAWGRQLFWVN